jgi:hypothetical protein
MAFHPLAGWCDCMSADFEKGGKQGFLNQEFPPGYSKEGTVAEMDKRV